jgi:hypothetical protein
MILAVDWGEVTAIATSILAHGALGAFAAAVFAAQQVREARKDRQTQSAIELVRRWDEDALVQAHRGARREAAARARPLVARKPVAGHEALAQDEL